MTAALSEVRLRNPTGNEVNDLTENEVNDLTVSEANGLTVEDGLTAKGGLKSLLTTKNNSIMVKQNLNLEADDLLFTPHLNMECLPTMLKECLSDKGIIQHTSHGQYEKVA